MASAALPTTAGRLGDESRHQDLVRGSPRSSWNLTGDSGEGALGMSESRLRPSQAHISGHDLSHLLTKSFTIMIRAGRS